eukprot:TRINITY_DN53194_c0_g1_i2.p1 TRINITY_DN53194_c0_g1~~TRINITY_DN53194_c0_g1_i2.p1  ORF type:complete len:396 (-),score=32.59 TRINITY_DN53194_c0_g1_i2:513-1700(-)
MYTKVPAVTYGVGTYGATAWGAPGGYTAAAPGASVLAPSYVSTSKNPYAAMYAAKRETVTIRDDPSPVPPVVVSSTPAFADPYAGATITDTGNEIIVDSTPQYEYTYQTAPIHETVHTYDRSASPSSGGSPVYPRRTPDQYGELRGHSPANRRSVTEATTASTEAKKVKNRRSSASPRINPAVHAPATKATPKGSATFRSKTARFPDKKTDYTTRMYSTEELARSKQKKAARTNKQNAVFRSDTPRFADNSANDVDYEVTDPREIAASTKKKGKNAVFASRTNRWKPLYGDIEAPTTANSPSGGDDNGADRAPVYQEQVQEEYEDQNIMYSGVGVTAEDNPIFVTDETPPYTAQYDTVIHTTTTQQRTPQRSYTTANTSRFSNVDKQQYKILGRV